MITKKLTTLAIVGVLLSSSAFAVLTQNWRIDAPTAPVLNDNETRGLAYNPSTGHLLVVRSSTSAPGIVVLNASTGATIGNMNISGVAGGTRPLIKVRVVDFGPAGYAVYACNLSLNSKTESFTIYRWWGTAAQSEDTLTTPEVVFRNRAIDAASPEASPVGPTLPQAFAPYSQRLGDTFWARSVGGNNVEFYVGVSRSNILNSVYKFSFTDPQVAPPGGASVSTVSEVTLKGLPSQYGYGNALRGEFVDANGNIWHQTNGALAVYSPTGVFQSMISGVHSSALHGVPLTISGKTYYCAIHHGVPQASTNAYARFSVTDVSSGPGQGQLIDFGPTLSTPNGNTNGTGDFATDGANIYALVTNNYIGSFAISPPPAGTTKRWAGQGSTSSWFDPLNWTPSGVPGPLDDVVLDHSQVAQAYTVTIDAAGQEASCRTLSIGDPISPSATITLQIANTATGNELLNIGGDNNPATPDIVVNYGGQFTFSPAALSGATSIYYFDPTATGKVAWGGYLLLQTTRSIATPFPGALASNLVPVAYGAWTFENGSTVEFNATSTAIPLSGRTYGNLILNGAVNYTASGGLPCAIKGTLTIGASATFAPGMSGPLTLDGNVVNNNTTASNFNATPLIIGTSMTWPANVNITGGLVVPAGVTLTCNSPLILGTTNGGKIAHIFGQLTCNNTLTINGTIAPRSGGVIDGSGSVTWGTNGGFATDNPSGFANMPPQSTDFPGFTLTGAFSGIPAQAAGVWGLCGDVVGQSAGALAPGQVGGLVIDTTGTVALAGDYQCLNVLSLQRGLVNVNGGAGTITLGSSVSSVGTLTYPSGYIALIQGTFKRWRAAGAALTSVDFPLADSAGVRRMLTLTASAAPSAGGTIAVRFSGTDPGGGPININPGGSTSSMDNLTKVDSKGSYLLTFGDGITFGATVTWTVLGDVDGFSVDPMGQQVAFIARDPANPTSWVGFPTPNAPTYKLHLMLQSLTNPEHPSFGVLRLQAAGLASSNFIYAGAAEVGVGAPSAWASVPEWASYR